MPTKYIKKPSGYCYKVQGNKKVRISKEEYKKKTKKTGGQIDPSNLPSQPTNKINRCASEVCNKCPDLNTRIRYMSDCAQK